MSKEDYYKTLNVPKNASESDIKKAYRKLALKYHPDRNPDNSDAENKFKELTKAYETLKDPAKKKNYDQFGTSQEFNFDEFSRQSSGQHGNPFKDFSGFRKTSSQDAFQDLFSDILSRGGASQSGPFAGHSPFPSKGTDLKYTLNITLEEAHSGCKKIIRFVRHKKGVQDQAKISVKIPPGVSSVQRLKLKNEGEQKVNEKTPGDLYVVVSIQKHPLFTSVDSNIKIEVPITFTEAVLGTQIEVPTIDGKVSLKIPPKTSSGKIFKLKGKGPFSHSKKTKGDLLVKITIDVPGKLTPDQTKIIEQLDRKLIEYKQIKSFEKKVKKLLQSRKK